MREQPPPFENVTALPEPPPVAATVNWLLKTALAGACVMTVIVWSAGFTVSAAVPELELKLLSPANDAVTPVGYEPAPMPTRLALFSVAVPVPSVVALPTLFPLSLNEIDSPGTGLPAEVSVAESVAIPPNVPLAAAGAVLVVAPLATSVKQTCTLESEGVTLGLDVVRIAS